MEYCNHANYFEDKIENVSNSLNHDSSKSPIVALLEITDIFYLIRYPDLDNEFLR